MVSRTRNVLCLLWLARLYRLYQHCRSHGHELGLVFMLWRVDADVEGLIIKIVSSMTLAAQLQISDGSRTGEHTA